MLAPTDGENDVTDSAELAESLVEQRLYRTQYLVLPKLAIQSMPTEWIAQLERLLLVAEQAGMETPTYVVLRDEPEFIGTVYEDPEDEDGTVDHYDVRRSDPWANYRRGHASDLCGFDISTANKLMAGQ